MKKASKAIAFAMASAMAVSMAACGGSASSSASGATTEDSASATGNGSYDQVTYVFAILAVSKIFIACIKKQSKR